MRKQKISETDLFDSMKSMKNKKTPGNGGLTKGFYEIFWIENSSYWKFKSRFPYENLKYFTKTSCHKAYWKKKTGLNLTWKTGDQVHCWMLTQKIYLKRFQKNWKLLCLW